MSPPIYFKDWLPDQPDFNNPGLTDAKNVRPIGGVSSGFQSYSPLSASGTAFSAATVGSIAMEARNAAGLDFIHIGTPAGKLYVQTQGSSSWTDITPAATTGAIVGFAQYDNFALAVDDTNGMMYQTLGSGSAFTIAVGAPVGQVVGRIGQFALVGNLKVSVTAFPHWLKWSSIGDPTDWPTPDSTTAIANQSGDQLLHQELGGITGIYGADEWGVILQSAGITRVNYVGGDTVFQFDTLADGIGMDYAGNGVRVGNLVYFASSKGLYATDGTQLIPIGEDKVNRWFKTNITASKLQLGSVGVDWTNKLICWCFPPSGGGTTIIVIYNFQEHRFTYANDTNLAGFVIGDAAAFLTYGFQGISQGGKLGTMTGTPGTATIATGELELAPSQYAFVSGVKPLVDVTANAITVALRTRNDLIAALTDSSEVTATARSGMCDFRTTARYFRTRLTVSGTFNAAQGIEINATPAGAV